MQQYISLFKSLPYFKVLDEYFGQCLPGLAIKLTEVELNGEEDDMTIRLTEYVCGPDLLKAFEKAKIDTERDGFRYVDLLWLVCNMYYGDNYNQYSNDQEKTPEAGADRAFSSIRHSAADVFLLLKKYKGSRGRLVVKERSFRKEWEEKTKEYWRTRRAEIRKEEERKWGDAAVLGEDWKYVEEEIRKDVDERIADEIEKAYREQDEWKRISRARMDLERVTLKIGGNTTTLESSSWWIEELFSNHLFVHFLRDIETVEQAKALNANRPGKKPEDNRITAIVYGISKRFFDKGLVKTKTPTNLKQFIGEILRLMGLKNNKGKLPSMQQIHKMIENLPKAKTDPKFYSASLRPVSSESLRHMRVDPEYELGWLSSKSRG